MPWVKTAAVIMAAALVGPLGAITPSASAASPSTPSAEAASGDGWAAIRWTTTESSVRTVGFQVGVRRYSASRDVWSPYSYVLLPSSARQRVVWWPNGTKSDLRVRARSASGYGAWTSVTTAAGRPGRVPGVAASGAAAAATVSWSAAASNGSTITGYRVSMRSGNDGPWTAWASRTTTWATRSTVFTGLTLDRSYQFTVVAVNSRGLGATGSPVAVDLATPPTSPPSTPPATTPPTSAPPTTAPPTTAPPTTPASLTPEVDRIVADTNAFRAANGKAPLAVHPGLNVVAGEWAQAMLDGCFFEHRSSFNVYPAGWSRAGENIAAGYQYTSVVQGWIDSPGHRANMLGDYTHIGVGYALGTNCYRTYFVQNFAKY